MEVVVYYLFSTFCALLVEYMIADENDTPYYSFKDLFQKCNKIVYIPLLNTIFVFVGVVILITPFCKQLLKIFRK